MVVKDEQFIGTASRRRISEYSTVSYLRVFQKSSRHLANLGHRTTAAFSEPVGRTGKNDCLLLIDVTDLAILDAVQIWLMAFVSIQHLCASTFFERHLVELQEPFSHFASLEILMGDIVRELDKSLRDSRQSKSTIPSEKFS